MKNLMKPIYLLLFTAIISGAISSSKPAEAMHFKPNAEIEIDFDVTLSWAAAWRAKDRDLNTKAMTDINTDDGGWNFDKGDMINNRWTAIADIDVRYKNIGIFARPRAFYDFVYMNDNANPGISEHWSNNNYLSGTIGAPDEFDSGVEDVMGQDAQFLDYFAYSNFYLGGRAVDFRIGQQVVAWGEQLYLQGGVASAMSYADLTAANLPGVELKEIYMPTQSASIRFDILNNLTAMGFYQWEWKPHILNQPGSYFSDSDVAGEAGNGLIYGPVSYPPGFMVIPRGKDQRAKDDGQFGAGFIYRADGLAETEFGFYYINYHGKSPLFHIAPDVSNYYFSYAEDIKLYGVSISTFINDVSLSGEFTYRQDYPLNISTGVYEDGDMAQAQIAALYTLGANPISDDVSFAGEIGYNWVPGKRDADMTYSHHSWGYSLTVTAKYYEVLTDLDVSIPITYRGNPEGSSPNKTFTEDADSISIGTTFTYRKNWELEISYVDFHHPQENTLADRDLYGLNLKYTF